MIGRCMPCRFIIHTYYVLVMWPCDEHTGCLEESGTAREADCQRSTGVISANAEDGDAKGREVGIE